MCNMEMAKIVLKWSSVLTNDGGFALRHEDDYDIVYDSSAKFDNFEDVKKFIARLEEIGNSFNYGLYGLNEEEKLEVVPGLVDVVMRS